VSVEGAVSRGLQALHLVKGDGVDAHDSRHDDRGARVLNGCAPHEREIDGDHDHGRHGNGHDHDGRDQRP